MTSYISSDICGGLGNQLFQISNILIYNKHLNQKKIIVFKYEENLFNFYNLPRKTFWKSLFLNQFMIIDEKEYNNINFLLINEKNNHKIDLEPFSYCPHNLLFKGYFQSFKYFDDDIKNEIYNLIFSNKELVNIAKEYYNKIKNQLDSTEDDIISIHIRRTDYVYSSKYHNALEFDYYKKALNYANIKKLVIFSDDIEWCKTNFTKEIYNYDNIYFVDINNVEIEFLIMCMFKNYIIANSTFSLWASFISPFDNKLIVAPKNWYGIEGPKDWNEIYHKYITIII